MGPAGSSMILRATPNQVRLFNRSTCCQICREVAVMERYRDAFEQEGEAPYDHLRALVDIQLCCHLGRRGDAKYLAYLLPWPLSLLESLGVEAGKAEAPVLAVVRAGDGYP